MSTHTIHKLHAGMEILYAGNQITHVSEEVAAAFQEGDLLLVVSETGDLLHVPAAQKRLADRAVTEAHAAFEAMGRIADTQISGFYNSFAAKLEESDIWTKIAEANAADTSSAKASGRSTTRLAVSDKMRRDMIDGLHVWRDAPTRRGQIVERVVHDGWAVEQVADALGVIGFVFEGRPNVFADATGVLRAGNTTVLRIGADALGTARAIMEHALGPALEEFGLPAGAVTLLDSPERAAGWALFSDARLSLAVARGSGKAVEQLGSVARHAGVPVSLHGTGGAWIVADTTADTDKFVQAVTHSLDRKVCNTLNVCCIPSERAGDLVPAFLQGLEHAGTELGNGCRLHVVEGSERYVAQSWFDTQATVTRAHGKHAEPKADSVTVNCLGQEWEWEKTPEVTLVVTTGMAEAARLFNQYSPQFVVSLITESQENFLTFYEMVNAPFVGNGFTRWVDGQYALSRPELGLSNWQGGRLFARGAVLSGDSIYTVRTRAVQSDSDLHR